MRLATHKQRNGHRLNTHSVHDSSLKMSEILLQCFFFLIKLIIYLAFFGGQIHTMQYNKYGLYTDIRFGESDHGLNGYKAGFSYPETIRDHPHYTHVINEQRNRM